MAENRSLSLSELEEEIKRAFQQWDKQYREESPLTKLQIYKRANPGPVASPRSAINQLLLNLLNELDGDDIKFAESLRMRFADGRTVRQTANAKNVEEGTIQKWQSAGWKKLAEVVKAKEEHLRSQLHEELLARLEAPSYAQLWGVDDHLASLSSLLEDPNGPRIIAIEGIGGIGKTSLTDQLVRHLIENGTIGHGPFAGCGWVTARNNLLTVGGEQKKLSHASLSGAGLISGLATQLFADEGRPIGLDPEQMLSKIQHRLAEQPHLIVVDNLETVEDTDTLIETLRKLINPTRVILTTRHNLFSQPDIYHYPVNELGEKDVLQLVRHEAEQRNLAILANASDEDLRPIYKTVGGNPLALRIVVGQTHIHALHDVLNDLTQARGKPIESLYTYIYWNAWNSLNEVAREAWLLMPLVNGNGMTWPQLTEFTDMEPEDLRHALAQLVTLNLVEHQGNLRESRYFIHSLTRSFLQVQVLKWGQDGDTAE
ncbi:MAG: NB-ARC domain-containing protein [Chloroflexota bacterium]